MPKRKRRSPKKFQHRPLESPRSIRLLSLHPSADLFSPLDVTLLETSLDEFPSEEHNYEALSYVWGAPTGSILCTCDGEQLLITPNCDEALRHLRSPDKHRMLWVDAICIDQGNSQESINERNVQITLMGEVYRSAGRVLCWLGEGGGYTAGVFERLRRIGNCPSKRELRKLMEYDEQFRQKEGLAPGSTCLDHIFCHSWHSRIWTLQEVAFARDCQVICGKEIISWDLYLIAARFLIYEEYIDELDAQAWKNYLSIKIRDDIRNSLLLGSEGGDDERTVELLTSSLTQVRHLQSTNPKDKIYGLYAVFSALNIPLPAPDYGKSLERIYEEACVSIILHSGSLKMLEYACSNARAPNLPSWVPDWQDEDVILLNPATNATEGSRISQTQLSKLAPDNGQLCVRGKVVGQITTRAEKDFATLEFPSGSLPILNGEKYEFVGHEVDSLRLLVHRVKLFREWIRLVDGIQSPYHDEESTSDSNDFFHNLVTFDSDSSFSSEFSDARLFNVWVDILQYPDTSYDLSNGEKVSEAWRKAEEADKSNWTVELFQCTVVAATLATRSASRDGRVPSEIAALLDFTAHISGNMGNRTLVLVHDALLDVTLPGTAFHTAMTGDSIVLLEGAEFPVVLRRRGKKGDKWVFVGPAFVVGVMDGEAWSVDEDGVVEGEIEEFVLV